MSKEWLSLLFGLVLGGLFGSVIWFFIPTNEANEVMMYYHQVGIYANSDNASNACAQLDALGLTPYTLHKDGNAVIICGLVFSEEESQAVKATLQSAGMAILEKKEMVSQTFKDNLENGDTEALLAFLESR